MDDPEIAVDLVFRTISGKSLVNRLPGIQQKELDLYKASQDTQDRAIQELKRIGFKIIVYNVRGISISGKKSLVRKFFGVNELRVPSSLTKYIETVSIQASGEFY